MTDSKSRIIDTECDPVALLAISTIAALVSLIATGCLLGVRNDLYLLPIASALYDQPQFAHDLFIQSLRYYASGPWIFFSGIANHIDITPLLFGLALLSRFLAFAGFLLCADLLGLRTRKDRALLAILLCITSLLRGQSLAGDGGLFINYFTHSEIANGLSLLLIYCVIRGSIVTAFLLEGLILFDNAFIGVWDAAIIAAVIATQILNSGVQVKSALIKCGIGSVIAAILATPVLWNILRNPDFGVHYNFDYVDFLEQFWPYHFIFEDIPLHDKIDFAGMVLLGISSFFALGSKGRPFVAAFIALLTIYGAGIAVPYVTHKALILNLHLLRDSTLLQLLTVLGSTTLAVKWWASENRIFSRILGPLLILVLCLPIRMTTIQPAVHFALACGLIIISVMPAILKRVPTWTFSHRLRFRIAAIVLIFGGFGIVTASNMVSNAHAQDWIGEWDLTGQWARTNTDSYAKFLIPTWYFRNSPGRVAAGSSQDEAVLNAGIFPYASQRSVWIDFRNGAAVMWSPSYYNQWHQRVLEVNRLTTTAKEFAYAKAMKIDYVIDVCSAKPSLRHIFSTRRLCVFRVRDIVPG